MNDRKLLAALLGSALLGGLVGAASATVFGSTRAPDATEAPAADSRELATEMRALRAALDGATARLAELAAEASRAELAAPAARPREPVGAIDAEALLAGLDERIERLSAALGQASPAGVRMPEGRLGTPDFPAAEVVRTKQFLHQHLLWDFARVAERYGLPDRSMIYDPGKVTWTYSLPDGRAVSFDFMEGVVARVR
jgi:hypothetical protein